MAKKPAARVIEQELENPTPEPEIRFNPHGEASRRRDERGPRKFGRNEVAPPPLVPPEPEKMPEMGEAPLVDVLVIQRSRDSSVFRFTLGEVKGVNPAKLLEQLEVDSLHDSGNVPRRWAGTRSKVALGRCYHLILDRLGIGGFDQ